MARWGGGVGRGSDPAEKSGLIRRTNPAEFMFMWFAGLQAYLGPGSGRPGPGTAREDARHRGVSGGETIVQIGLLWAEFRSKNGKRPEIVLLFPSLVTTAKTVGGRQVYEIRFSIFGRISVFGRFRPPAAPGGVPGDAPRRAVRSGAGVAQIRRLWPEFRARTDLHLVDRHFVTGARAPTAPTKAPRGFWGA